MIKLIWNKNKKMIYDKNYKMFIHYDTYKEYTYTIQFFKKDIYVSSIFKKYLYRD